MTRPNVICHMMSTVDGRLVVERYTPPFDGKPIEEVGGVYFELASKFDVQALIVGRKTAPQMVSGTVAVANDAPTAKPETHVGRKAARYFVILDPSGSLQYEAGDVQGDAIIAILSEKVSDRYLATLRSREISYIFAGPDGSDLARALDVLSETFGVGFALLQGGGIINGAFLKAGLIDELSLVLYPGIDGLSGAPSIFEYKGEPNELPAEGQALEFKSAETLDNGCVWLRYRFHRQ